MIPTRKIKPYGEGQGDYVLINVDDFDPEKHEALDDAVSAPVLVEGGIGTASGDQFSDDQLRDAIKAVTGKAPHHKLGREKLIEEFNALNAETE